MVYSDNELLSQIAEGDEYAFSTLYFRYDRMLYAFLLKLTRSESTAEELLQETFLRLWLYRDSLAEVEHPRAYIHRIAANLSHRWLQEQFRHHKVLQEQGQPPDTVNSPEDKLAWKDMEALVARIIAGMPEQRRKIYQLHRDEGLSSGEIAGQVGVTTSTVRNTIAAAIRQIREQLLGAGFSMVLILYGEDGTEPGLLAQLIEQTATDEVFPMEDRERRLSAILEIDKTISIHKKTTHPLRISFRRWGWVAASVLLLLAEGAVVMLAINANRKEQHAQAIIQDIAPGSNKAILTLGNGATIRLDGAGSQLIQQGAVTVRQAGAQLIYDVRGSNAGLTYNTLATPRGGQFRVQLPDGTLVWLNAASSLRYPTAFDGKERTVEISGEAYFEVAAAAGQPFMVKIGETAAVEVLGTRFNVNAYRDEAGIQTTLLTGAVRVVMPNTGAHVLLKPGQQAQIAGSQPEAGIKIIGNANIDKIMAWKNGLFNFENAGPQEVMRQLARWYDLQVVYENGVPDMYFEGEMSREMSLSHVLAGLQQTGVRFRIAEGRRLVVLKQ
ncbi:MAG TPA: sigma-70 family RNA polymerase sigma factor [Chitinophaga sp.]